MAIIQRGRIGRKPTGGMYHPVGRKRVYELGSKPSLTTPGERRVRTEKTKSGTPKTKVYVAKTANCFDPKTKKFVQAEIKYVAENPANRHYVRRNVMTKGAVVETDKGKARITSRPGQHGTVNAILLH